jgi:tetratricopeptide (TPR) repeat protein
MALRLAALIVGVLLLLGPVSGAVAQNTPTDGEARNLFLAGQDAFAVGSYERAMDYFERAYLLSHRSGLLYNIAITADRLRRDARALEAFREYLIEEPATERRAEVQARINFLAARVAEAEREAERVRATQVQTATVVEAETETDTEPVATVAPTDGGGGVHPAGVLTLVGGVFLLGVFGVSAALSEIEDQALAQRCGRDRGATCAPTAVRTLETFNLIADISWIAGAAAAITGITY